MILGPAKACTKCGETKPLTDFSFDPRVKTRRITQCRKCVDARGAEWKREKRRRAAEERAKFPKQTTGNADPLNHPMSGAFLQRYWERVNKDGPGGCWLWTGYTRNGYGALRLAGAERQAHRLALRIAGEALNPKLVVDHTCKVKICVNPLHLRQVSQRFNSTANSESPLAKNYRVTHCGGCKRPYSPENTYYYSPSPKSVGRVCLHCYKATRPGSKRQPNTRADAIATRIQRHGR